ncbi:probable E3 SUMO-protein ligase RNF212 isoform X2 [Leopardus geoffroyi]|uniref:probable E3 SUMO-protein ligase RNF212 isoform X2 n=1 Tax=Leopardus geoffroyi TaxID=46844 RepID=UPI001E25E7F3|nr:probable E3 SUMO-protein ligase RNF212 isoform X2 [Leopardus geoffroyi]
MASWVFCNRCFQPPHRTSCFSLTNCGHVYCDVCLDKGRKGECLICKVPCRTLLLSEHTDADIRALFAGIDDLCRKYSKETFQVSEFQEKHRRRLLAFYREKISKLEESLRKSVLRLEQLQGRVPGGGSPAPDSSGSRSACSARPGPGGFVPSRGRAPHTFPGGAPLPDGICQSPPSPPEQEEPSMRLSQQTAFSTIKTPVSTPSARPGGHLRPPDSSASNRVESMQVDLTPSPARKPEVTAGPARISLISPPHDGRMGIRPRTHRNVLDVKADLTVVRFSNTVPRHPSPAACRLVDV